jgi:RNA-dependent RNA polymerase
MNHSLREVKFKARIPVPKSYQLVGVADEGQAYIKEGVNEEDVFTLGEGRIYGAFLRGHSRATLCKRQHSVCVQEKANEPPKYFKGTCVISRSPVIHPGDGTYICMLTPIQVILISLTVQRVYAVGEPPEDNICFFRGLKNVVVLPAVGACQRVSRMPSLTNPPSGERSLASCLAGGDLDGYVSTWQGASDAHNALVTHTTSTMIIQV